MQEDFHELRNIDGAKGSVAVNVLPVTDPHDEDLPRSVIYFVQYSVLAIAHPVLFIPA